MWGQRLYLPGVLPHRWGVQICPGRGPPRRAGVGCASWGRAPHGPRWPLQELSKITMPIAFNEPLSFLQRITEYMEHVYLVHKASRQPQSLDRMQVGARAWL